MKHHPAHSNGQWPDRRRDLKVRREALEEAAQVCDEYEKRHTFGDGTSTVQSNAAHIMAVAIRALIDKPMEKKE